MCHCAESGKQHSQFAAASLRLITKGERMETLAMLVRHLFKELERGGMSKLFKLKEWLTIPEAAKHLSAIFSEDVIEADVLRLALDGHLKLSINFVNHTQGKRGRFISFKDTKWKLFPKIVGVKQANAHFPPAKIVECPPHLLEKLSEIPEDERDNYYPLPMSLHVDGERFIDIDDEVTTIKGIWDLSMIGAERIAMLLKLKQLRSAG